MRSQIKLQDVPGDNANAELYPLDSDSAQYFFYWTAFINFKFSYQFHILSVVRPANNGKSQWSEGGKQHVLAYQVAVIQLAAQKAETVELHRKWNCHRPFHSKGCTSWQIAGLEVMTTGINRNNPWICLTNNATSPHCLGLSSWHSEPKS